MRIIGGEARGRRLHPPPNSLFIRPSSDMLRESLANILDATFSRGNVLDLFAGTGAVGIEALSRGAAGVVFVDHDLGALRLIEKNLALVRNLLAPDRRVHLLRRDLRGGLDFLLRPGAGLPESYHCIFLDPPYEKNLAVTTLGMVEKAKLLAHDGMLVAEERWPAELPELLGTLRLVDRRRYGTSGLWFYCLANTP